MCSRYDLTLLPRDLARRYGLPINPPTYRLGEVRPTDRVPAITAPGRAELLTWGIPAAWDGKPLINARAETLATKKTFRPLLESRCLVPASAYFEWRRVGRERLKNRIAPADGEPFAFAGLHDGTSFTIVTCAPAPAIAHVHDRMPVILPIEAEAAWIDPALAFERVAGLLRPFAAQPLSVEESIPPGHQPPLL